MLLPIAAAIASGLMITPAAPAVLEPHEVTSTSDSDYETPDNHYEHRAPATERHEKLGGLQSAKSFAHSLLPDGQYQCLARIVEHESGWNAHAKNASSGAYGLGQALPASKMSAAGSDWRTNPKTQLRWMIHHYIPQRYGSPCGAWSFWQRHHWY